MEGFTLDMVDGGGVLQLRDAEPYELENPTSITGSLNVNDPEMSNTGTGAITAGTFSTPTVEFSQDITTPIPATVVIRADFSPVTPNNLTGSISPDGDVFVSTNLRVRLDVQVQPPGGGTPFLTAICNSSPINLALESTAPYDADTQRVTLATSNFTVPAVAVEPSCDALIRGEINNQLAGSGHSLSITFGGELTPPDQPGDESVTALTVTPEGGARLGDTVTLSAEVTPGPTAEADDVPTGFVDFRDGSTVLSTVAVEPDGSAELSTSSLPAGTRSLTARYRGDSVYGPSASAAVSYPVAATPQITASLPSSLRIGGDPVDFDVDLDNSGFGSSLEDTRLEVTIQRVTGTGPLGPVGGDPRFVLSRMDGDDPIDIPLTATTATRLDGTVLDVGDLALPPGSSLTETLRIQATGVGTPSTTTCTAANVTCPGPILVTLRLVQVGESNVELASSAGDLPLTEAQRRPSTIIPPIPLILPPVSPNNIVRQGNTVTLASYSMGPAAPTRPTGLLEMSIDGRRIDSRSGSQPLADGYTPTVPFAGGFTLQAPVPLDTPTGTRTLTVRYLGDSRFLPSTHSVTIQVLPALGTPVDCSVTALSEQRFSANLLVSAPLPAAAPAGSTVPLPSVDVRLVADRSNGTVNSVLGMAQAEEITLAFGPSGSGTVDGVQHLHGAAMATPDAVNPDQILQLLGSTGQVVIEGEPGDVVPITLETIRFQHPGFGGIPAVFQCSSLGTPVVLGEVVAAGTTLSVDPAGPVRSGAEVALSAEVQPSTSSGFVEFLDVTDPEAPATVAFAPVSAGVSSVVVDDLPVGDRMLRARYFGGVALPSTTSPDVGLRVLGPPECAEFVQEGSGAVVRLVYLELLRRCPDQGGFDYWVQRLDAGTSPEVFARSIASTPEAVGVVVNDGYQTMLGRNAETAGKAFWVNRMIGGTGRYDQLLADLGASDEFWTKAGSTNQGFVERVYDRLLHRSPDQAGLNYWVGRLDNGASRRALILSLANLDEPLGVLVTQSYGAMLDRAPDSDERTNGITFLRTTGDRSSLYAQLIGRPEFHTRAQGFPNPDD